MGFVGDFISDIFGGGGDDAAEASQEAAATSAEAIVEGARIQAESQREALGYLKEREEIPQQFREGALKGLGGLYGLPGGTGSQQELVDRAISSPLYRAIMSGREVGEESILANAAMTGGFRSGNVQGNLYDYNIRLPNQALLESYNEQLQGLTRLAGLPSNVNQIAGMTAGIGQTLGQGQATAGNILGQGQIAAAQAEQAGRQQGFGNLLGLGALGIGAYSAGMFSDRRLKKNIEKIGEVNGWPWFRWKWNSIAEKMGMKGECQGTMADIVFKKQPDAVIMKDGFLWVKYDKIGILKKACHA